MHLGSEIMSKITQIIQKIMSIFSLLTESNFFILFISLKNSYLKSLSLLICNSGRSGVCFIHLFSLNCILQSSVLAHYSDKSECKILTMYSMYFMYYTDFYEYNLLLHYIIFLYNVHTTYYGFLTAALAT